MALLATLLLAGAAGAAGSAPHGLYVEGRSATVFAGACHYGSEYGSRGREAVLGFSFEGGVYAGEELAGLDLVVVVTGDRNLDEEGVRRTSTLYLPRDASPAQRAALAAWVRDEHGETLGAITAQRTLELGVERDAERFHIRAGAFADLDARALPDDSCCTMPFQVWYEPLVSVRGRKVGTAASFVAADATAGTSFRLTEQNCVFYGAF